MRVLFSTTAAYGHFHPLVPLARAFADDGHEVAFATAESFGEQVERAGFPVLAAGMQPDELVARFAPYRERLLQLPIPVRRPYAFTWRFATLEATAKLRELHDVATRWRPDLVIFESADLAAPVVAAALGIPRAHHAFGRLVPVSCYERAASEAASLWSELGLDPPPLCGAFEGVYLDICPPSFQTAVLPAGTSAELVRPGFATSAGEQPPAWIGELPDRATVYLTLGTVHNDLSLFRLLLDALAEIDCNVVATIGRGNDPALLEPIPGNARVERYVSQALVLPHVQLVVAHGGSGSILATFAHGLQSLLVPQGADQFENAGRCAELGAGRALLPDQLTTEAVREAVVDLLAEPSYGERARELAAEIEAMPEPCDVARGLATRWASGALSVASSAP